MRGDGKTLLLKVRFMEWLVADPGLSASELRVGLFLLSRFWFKEGSIRDGASRPGYDGIADALGICRRTAFNCVQRLLERDKFILLHQGCGKGNANVYRPNFEAMPEGCAFAEARRQNAAHQTNGATRAQCNRPNGAIAIASLPSSPEKKDTSVPLPRHCATMRSAVDVELKVAWRREPDLNNRDQCRGFLRTVQAEINTGRFRAADAAETIEVLEALVEIYDGHLGDDIGGWAYRLLHEVSAYLPDDDELAGW